MNTASLIDYVSNPTENYRNTAQDAFTKLLLQLLHPQLPQTKPNVPTSKYIYAKTAITAMYHTASMISLIVTSHCVLV